MSTSLTIGIVMLVLTWVSALGFLVWLQRQPRDRQDNILLKFIKFNFSRNLRDDMSEEKQSRMIRFLFWGTIIGDTLATLILAAVGWRVVGGAEGDETGLWLTYVVAPAFALHGVIFVAFWRHWQGYEVRRRREDLLGGP